MGSCDNLPCLRFSVTEAVVLFMYVMKHRTSSRLWITCFTLVTAGCPCRVHVCLFRKYSLWCYFCAPAWVLSRRMLVRGYQLVLVQRGVSVRGCASTEGIPSCMQCIWFLKGVLRSSTGTPGPRDLPLATYLCSGLIRTVIVLISLASTQYHTPTPFVLHACSQAVGTVENNLLNNL
jgi:hypothetical protein